MSQHKEMSADPGTHARKPLALSGYVVLMLSLFLVTAPPLWAQSAGDGKDDPFYGQKGQYGATDVSQLLADSTQAIFQQVQESVAPFTGNLSLVHTDLVLPGDGGFDLKVQRVYNSRIWGRRDTSAPGVVAYNERSIAGLGWSFHFGRVRNPFGSGSQNPTVGDNPVIELSDGSTHPLYADINDPTRATKITVEQWKYRQGATSNIFLLTLTDGTVYEFTSANEYFTLGGTLSNRVWQVSKITDPNGNIMTFAYDPTDTRKVTSVTDTLGRSVTFTYTTISNAAACTVSYTALSSMTVNGKIYNYAYQPLSSATLCHLFLSSVTPPTGPAWTYTYGTTNPGLYELTSSTSPRGAIYSYGYGDVFFNVGEPALPSGIQFSVVTSRTVSGAGVPSATWTYDYGPVAVGANQVTTVTEAGCRIERFTYASFGTVINGNIWKVGLPLKKEVLSGTTVIQQEDYVWNPSPAISNDGRSNGLWGPTPITDTQIFMPLLASRTVTQDGRTYTTSYSSYNAFASPQTIAETGNATRTTALTYYTDTTKNIVRGLPLSSQVTVGTQSFTTSYTYDLNGNLKTRTQYGVLTTFNYFPNGNLQSRVDALNRTTGFTYQNGRVSTITNPVYGLSRVISLDGNIQSETNGRNFTTTFTYDNLNRVTQVSPPTGNPTTVTYNDTIRTRVVARSPASTTFTLDGLGRVTSSSATGSINTATTYNACGQKTYQSFPYTGSNIGDTFAYDVLNRITTITHPDATTIGYNYANGNVAITNERAKTTTYTNSAFGDPTEKRLVSVADATGTTSYTYNTVGSLTGISHPGGMARSFAYDTRNFLTGETHPETGTITYGRDAIGNLTSKLDGKGTTGYGYDPLNRLTSIDYPGTADDTTFTYDNADNRATVSSPTASTTFQYDAANRMTSQQATVGTLTKTTTYAYDGADNLITLTYPTGRVLIYGYDAANRVTSLSSGSVTYVSAVTYHPSRAMTSLTFGNGKVETILYDNRYRVSSLQVPALVGLTYGYDGANNALSITDAVAPSKNRTMTYDDVDRLLTANGVWGAMAFTYSPVGNRLTKTLGATTSTYAYGATNNRLTGVTGGELDATIAYDANGNMTGLRGFTLAYDSANRLTSVNTAAVTYTYDGDGQRITKINAVTPKTTLYWYDRGGQLLVETDATGVPASEYLYLNGQLIVRIDPNATPPVISAITVSGISNTGATINWTTDIPANSQVEYGVTTAYGSTTAVTPALVTTRSVALTGLTQAMTYHYRVRSADAGGNASVSLDGTFVTTGTDTTAPSAPTLTGVSASASQINLSWTGATDNVGVTSYRVWRCQLPDCTPDVLVGSPTGTTFSNTGLTANILYTYWVMAVDAAGNIGPQSNAVFVTTVPDTQIPSVPTGLTATSIGPAQINLGWIASTDNVGVTGYRVERCQGSGCTTFAQVGTPAGTSFSDATLTPNMLYRYQVRAADAAGNLSAFSIIASATTPADTVAPAVPAGLTATAVGATQINLAWAASTDNVAVTGYRVERCQGAGCSTFTQVGSPTGPSFNDTGLSVGLSYSYRVRASDASGNLSGYSTVSSATTQPDTQAPSVPNGLTATAASPTTVNLSWTASTDNVSVTGYPVERCQGAGCTTFVQIATPTGLTYSDTGLLTNASYSYRIRATDAAGNLSGYSITTTVILDVTPPVLSAISAGGLTSSSAVITWTSNEPSSSQVEYGVTTAYGTSSPNDTTLVTSHSVTLSGLASSTTYQYRVRSVDAAGNVAFSLNGTFSTLATAATGSGPASLTATPISSTQINLSWPAGTCPPGLSPAQLLLCQQIWGPSYDVERCTGLGCTNFTVRANTGAALTYNDTGLTPGTTYRYRIRTLHPMAPVDSYSPIQGAMTFIADTQAPTAPNGLTATAATSTQVNLSWIASTDNVGIDHYEVYRSLNNGPFMKLSPDPISTAFADAAVTAGTVYRYQVVAKDAAGNASLASTIDLATTILFTDDPLVVGSTEIKAIHVTELRTAVNLVRSAAGLPAIVWTDPTLTTGVSMSKAVHIQELRDALNPARTALGVATITFTDPTLTGGGSLIKKVHLDELRSAIR